MKTLSLFFLVIFLFCTNSSKSWGLEENSLVIGLGQSNIFEPHDSNTVFNLEYRFSQINPDYTLGLNNLSIIAGADTSSESEFYAYSGLLYDAKLFSNIYFSPSVVAGYYNAGSGKELGRSLLFKSTIELSYEVIEGHRIGTQISHISNASLGERNPGSESYKVNYLFPLE